MKKDPQNPQCCMPARPESNSIPEACAESEEGIKNRTYSSEMISCPGGSFLMGSEDADSLKEDAEGPVREVHVDAFSIDATTVTNSDFEKFVRATGYVTEAERFDWSYVFILQLPRSHRRKVPSERTVPGCDWWVAVPHAHWKAPEGHGSSIQDRMDHPVVHVSWNDANAFAKWAGKRLPTEAEWEYAARGGLVQQRYAWGNELTPNGKHMCNIWQGKFPTINRPEDGFLWTAPVKSFPPNGYGLHQMCGNVWEWCADRWSTPPGWNSASINPPGSANGVSRVMRGGSFLCHQSYCNRYRVAARSKNTPDSSTTNCGFRCAR